MDLNVLKVFLKTKSILMEVLVRFYHPINYLKTMNAIYFDPFAKKGSMNPGCPACCWTHFGFYLFIASTFHWSCLTTKRCKSENIANPPWSNKSPSANYDVELWWEELCVGCHALRLVVWGVVGIVRFENVYLGKFICVCLNCNTWDSPHFFD